MLLLSFLNKYFEVHFFHGFNYSEVSDSVSCWSCVERVTLNFLLSV